MSEIDISELDPRYLSATDIREAMPTKQDILNQRLDGFMDSLFSSIVSQSKQYIFEYSCNLAETVFGLNQEETTQMLDKVVNTLTQLGFKVKLEQKTDTNETKFQTLTVDWKEHDQTY